MALSLLVSSDSHLLGPLDLGRSAQKRWDEAWLKARDLGFNFYSCVSCVILGQTFFSGLQLHLAKWSLRYHSALKILLICIFNLYHGLSDKLHVLFCFVFDVLCQILNVAKFWVTTMFPVPGTEQQLPKYLSEEMNFICDSLYKPQSLKMAENSVTSRGRARNPTCQWDEVISVTGFWLPDWIQIQNSELSRIEITNLGHSGAIWADEFFSCFLFF